MSDDRKLVWLVNNIAGVRVAQKNAIGTDRCDFEEFHSSSNAIERLAQIESRAGKLPDLIITGAGANITEASRGIPVITITGDVKELKDKIQEILPPIAGLTASMRR